MVVENGYNTSVNNTSNENNSNIMDSLQKYVKGLESQLAENERMIKARDQEIIRLQNENKQLRTATPPHFYHQNQPRFQSFDRVDFRQKVPEFRREITRAVDKVLENFLGEQISNPQSPNRPQGWDAPPIQVHSPLTTQPPTPDRSVDDSSTNISSSTNLVPNELMNQSTYQGQDLGSNTSSELVEDSKEESREPTSYNNINNDNELKQSSQNSSTSSLNGVMNRRYNGNNNNNNNNNNSSNNNNMMNKRRAYTPYTAFVSWQGPTAPPLKNFFPTEDVKDIRQSPNKSFAHIDFTSNDALERALGRNNTPLNAHGIQGNLRVEKGKPRSNTTGNENVQRPQYQNQNQNKYPQKKNGFNSTSSHNSHHYMVMNGYPNHNGHTNDSYPSHPSQEDKTQDWQQFSKNNGELPASNPQDYNKNTED